MTGQMSHHVLNCSEANVTGTRIRPPFVVPAQSLTAPQPLNCSFHLPLLQQQHKMTRALLPSHDPQLPRMQFLHAITVLLSIVFTGSSICAEPVLNPKVYRSPSLRFRMTVNPTSPLGIGDAEYLLEDLEKKTISISVLPNTVWDAVLLDTGELCGYGYSNGLDGTAELGAGTLDLMVVNSACEMKIVDRIPRTIKDQILHSRPSPIAMSPCVVFGDGQVLVRTYSLRFGENLEQWHAFSGVLGKAQWNTVPLKQEQMQYGRGFIKSVLHIPHTDYFSVECCVYAPKGKISGSPTYIYVVDNMGRALLRHESALSEISVNHRLDTLCGRQLQMASSACTRGSSGGFLGQTRSAIIESDYERMLGGFYEERVLGRDFSCDKTVKCEQGNSIPAKHSLSVSVVAVLQAPSIEEGGVEASEYASCPRFLACDSKGRYYAIDEVGQRLLMYRNNGQLMSSKKISFQQTVELARYKSLAFCLNDAGYLVYRAPVAAPSWQYFRFTPEGEDLQSDILSHERVFNQYAGGSVLLMLEGVVLEDSGGNEVKYIKKRCSQEWLYYPISAAFTPDGLLGVLTSYVDSENAADHSTCLSVYDHYGHPVRDVRLPSKASLRATVFGGEKLFAVISEGEVFLVDKRDWSLSRLHVPQKYMNVIDRILMSPDGNRLLISVRESPEIMGCDLLK